MAPTISWRSLSPRARTRGTRPLDLLKGSGFVLEPSNRKWWLRDRHKTLSFLAAHGQRLRGGLGAEFTPNFTARTATFPMRRSPARSALGRPLGHCPWDQGGACQRGCHPRRRRGGAKLRRGRGQIVLIDPARVRKPAEAQRALSDGELSSPSTKRTDRIGPARAAEVEELLEELAPGFQPPDEWKRRTGALRNLSRLEPAPMRPDFDSILRTYQRLGAAWLWHLHRCWARGHPRGRDGTRQDAPGAGAPVRRAARAAARASSSAPRRLSRTGGARRPASPPTCASSCTGATSGCESPGDLAALGPGHHLLRHADARPRALLRRPSSRASWRTRPSTEEPPVAERPRAPLAPVQGPLPPYGHPRRELTRRPPLPLRVHPARATSSGPAGARAREERSWFDERLRAKTAHYILRRTKLAVAPELPARIEQVVWCTLEPAQAALYRSFQEKSERELFDLEASGRRGGARCAWPP